MTGEHNEPGFALVIPDECVKFIRWQRSLFVTAIPDPEAVKARYRQWVHDDFVGMAPHLPEQVEDIIDVGCGMAGIQVYAKGRYPNARLSLLDGDGDSVKGGWNDVCQPFNSRECTALLLGANGVYVDRWIDVGTTEHLRADLIISLASWGYHYPFSTYTASGFVICDLRRSTEGSRIERIRDQGGKIIFRGPKYDRCAWRELNA